MKRNTESALTPALMRQLKFVGAIPAHWRDAPIGEVFNMQLGKMLSQKSKTGVNYRAYLGNSNVKWGEFDLRSVEEMDFSDDEFEKFRLQAGDILVCEGGEVGRTAIWKGELENCCYQKALHRLRPANDAVVPEYFQFYMELAASQSLFLRYTNESSIAHLSQETLAKVRIPIPPRHVQERIVAVLSALSEAIEATRAVIDQTRQLKTALLQDLLTNGVPGQKTRKVPALKPLSEQVSYWQYGLSSSLSDKGQYPCLRMNNYATGKIIDSDLKYIDLPSMEFERYRLRRNDILFNRTNSRDLVGKVGIFQLEGQFVFASYLVRLTANSEKVLPEFLNILLNSEMYQQRIRDLATPGVSQCNINVENLKKLETPIPSLAEQREVVRVMETIDIRLAAEDMTLASLTSTKTALSQGLLTGIISVKERH